MIVALHPPILRPCGDYLREGVLCQLNSRGFFITRSTDDLLFSRRGLAALGALLLSAPRNGSAPIAARPRRLNVEEPSFVGRAGEIGIHPTLCRVAPYY